MEEKLVKRVEEERARKKQFIEEGDDDPNEIPAAWAEDLADMSDEFVELKTSISTKLDQAMEHYNATTPIPRPISNP